jgi:hypothetical protein
MSTPTGYEGVTARIAGRLMTGTPPLRQWMAEQIVQAEFAPLVEAALKRIEHGHSDTCAAVFNDHVQSSVECDCGHSLLRAALDRVRTP